MNSLDAHGAGEAPVLKPDPDNEFGWELAKDWHFEETAVSEQVGFHLKITVRKGFRTDLASVPRPFWSGSGGWLTLVLGSLVCWSGWEWLGGPLIGFGLFWALNAVPPFGRHSPGALAHDALCRDNAKLKVSREMADSVFSGIMRAHGVKRGRVLLMWLAVRVFNIYGWERARRKNLAQLQQPDSTP